MVSVRLLCLVLVLALCSGCVKWRTHESLQDKFTVSVPGYFTKSKVTKKTGIGSMHYNRYQLTKNGVSFVVQYGELPDIVRSEEASKVLSLILKYAQKKTGVRLAKLRRVNLAGVPGYTYSIARKIKGIPADEMESTYLRDGFLYVVSVGAKRGELKKEWAKKFLASFRLTKGLD